MKKAIILDSYGLRTKCTNCKRIVFGTNLGVNFIMRPKFFMFPIFLMLTSNADAEIVINELMQSNIYCLMDDLNDFPDSWVELYNTERRTINLKDYRLGLNQDASQAWQLPDVEIGSLRAGKIKPLDSNF